MTDHEERIRDRIKGDDSLYTNMRNGDLRALLADLDANRRALKYARRFLNAQDHDVAFVDAALSAAKDGGWLAVQDCPDGDVWFALSCGHVVMGYKTGDMLDWEAMIDHDCCSDALAIKAQPVATPTHPDLTK